MLTSTLTLRCGRNLRIRLPTECPRYTIPVGDRIVVVASEGCEVRLANLTINAIYVLEFWVLLVSVGELDRIGLKSVFANGTCRIWEVG